MSSALLAIIGAAAMAVAVLVAGALCIAAGATPPTAPPRRRLELVRRRLQSPTPQRTMTTTTEPELPELPKVALLIDRIHTDYVKIEGLAYSNDVRQALAHTTTTTDQERPTP